MWEIGVDLVEVQRFSDHDYMSNKDFYKRIFTPREISYCLSFKQSAQHFAATFASKEAVYKALNRKMNITLNHIEIIRNGDVPEVNLLNTENRSPRGTEPLVKISISLSHTPKYAVAFAIAEFKDF
jgi:holo-[acyl-carrier protein] synthase